MSQDNAPKKSRRPQIIVGVLFVYMVVMAIGNRETLTVHHQYGTFFGTIAAELIVLTALFYFLRKRETLREERKKDLEQAAREREALNRRRQAEQNDNAE